MRRASVSDLKNRLSEFLRLVKRGEGIEVCERGVPIARLVGLPRRAETADDRLEWLVREGVVSTPKAGGSAKGLLRLAPVPCSGDAAAAVAAGRGER